MVPDKEKIRRYVMKKIFLSLFAAIVITLPVSAAIWSAADRVPVVGKQLLSKNSLPSNTTFKVTAHGGDNSNVAYTNVVYISKDLLEYAGNDNEVAAVVSTELGHIINGHYAKNKMLNLAKEALTSNLSADNVITTTANSDYVANKTSLNDNKEADITGVDMMVQAGYNPLAMVVVITKMPGSTWEILTGKPANAERAMNVYDYLTYNYPSKVKAGYGCNEYRAFLSYADPIVEKRNSSTKKLEKFNKEQEKAKQERAANIAKYKATGGLSGWDATYTILKNLSEGSEK